MDFIKRQLFLIVCGAVGLAGVGLAAWGMTNETIIKDMEAGAAISSQLKRYMRGPVPEGAESALPAINQQAIDYEEQRIKTIQEYYEDVLAKVKEINRRGMLRDDVFPAPRNTSAPFNFLLAYREALFALPESLNEGREVVRGEVPTQREVELVRAMMEERLRQESAHQVGIRPQERRPADRSAEADRSADLASLSPEELVSRDPRAQACVRRARSINAYMSRSALDRSPIINANVAPTPEEMWHAQMTYLIQKDVIEALKAVNKAAADELKAVNTAPADDKDRPETPWVGNLPVKDVRQIIVDGGGWQELYVIGESSEPGSYRRPPAPRAFTSEGKAEGLGPPPTGPNDVFTKRVSNPEYDVIRFALHVVVDERDIPKVLAGICKTNFYVVLSVSYKAVPPDTLFQGKVYGSEPAVLLSADFDAYLFRDNYKDLMPKGIKELLGVVDQPVAQ